MLGRHRCGPERAAAVALGVACVLAAGGALEGCVGTSGTARVGPAYTDVATLWDAALKTPRSEKSAMVWAEGEVTGVSLDGSAMDIRIKRGVVERGARIGVYVPVPRAPGPHYLHDEARELHVVEAAVVQVAGNTCKAEVLNRDANAPVAVGDKIIVRIP